MQRLFYTALAALVLTAAAAPAAFAGHAGTSTCPLNAMHCVGSGGGAGK